MCTVVVFRRNIPDGDGPIIQRMQAIVNLMVCKSSTALLRPYAGQGMLPGEKISTLL